MNLILRITIAGIFIFSGVAKLISVDTFEIYITSFNIFPLTISAVLARLTIGVEFIIALFFIFNIYPKLNWYFTSGLILLFTIFLILLAFTGSKENCNCFGELVKMSPIESIIKNILIIGLLIFLKLKPYTIKKQLKPIYIIGLTIITFIIVFAVPPYNNLAGDKINFPISEFTEKKEIIQEKFTPTDTFNIYQDKKIVCFYSLRCKYCRNALQKLTILANSNNFSNNVLIFFTGQEKNVKWFFNASKSDCFPYRMLDIENMSYITNGSVPKMFLVENGIIKSSFSYSDMPETEIISFFTENKNE